MSKNLTICCDGSSIKNPGPSGAGILVLISNKPYAELSISLGLRTNNQSEYLAVFYGTKFVIDNLDAVHQGSTLNIKTDSQLVIKQLSGEWIVKDDHLRRNRTRVLNLLDQLFHWEISYAHWADTDKPHVLAQHAARTQRDNLLYLMETRT